MSKADGRTYHKTQVCSFCRKATPVWHVYWRSLTGNVETEGWLCDYCAARLESWGVKVWAKIAVSR